MNAEYDFTKHLVAKLFHKAAEAIEAAPRKDLDDILTHHENLLVGILNNSKLLHTWATPPGEKKLLNGMGRGYAQPGLPKDAQPTPAAAPADVKRDAEQSEAGGFRLASKGGVAA